MSEVSQNDSTNKLTVTYDGVQHCTAARKDKGKIVATDACPATGGKGEELSPSELLGSGLTGCMMLVMGMVALRDNIDLTGMTATIDFAMIEKPVMRIDTIDMQFDMVAGIPGYARVKLERSVHECPIKSSLHPDITINCRYIYPD